MAENDRKAVPVTRYAEQAARQVIIVVEMEHRGRLEEYRLREVGALERDEINRQFPSPDPPRAANKEGVLYADLTDPAFLAAANEAVQRRVDETVRRGFGNDYFGTTDPAEQLAMLRREYEPSERRFLARRIWEPDRTEEANAAMRPSGDNGTSAPASPTP